jgi:hypothetical protein
MYENNKKGITSDDKEINTDTAIQIEESYFHFKNIQFNTAETKILKIKNISKKKNEFYFINKNGDKTNISKPFLSVYPRSGIIHPEETFEVNLTVLVNSESAKSLNKSIDSEISDNLIIHVEDGNDYPVII